MTEIRVRQAHWDADREALQSIRRRVFIEEQRVPLELEWDGLDAECVHFLAIADGKPVGTARITPQKQIGRMAVLAPYRRRGVGRRLLERVLEHARSAGYQRVYLHAQVSAIAFYTRAGFRVQGEAFEEAGITHRAMTLNIC